MSLNSTIHSDAQVQDEGSKFQDSYRRSYFGNASDSFLISITFLNLIFTLMRLQDFTGMGFLGSIRLPGILSLISIALVLPSLSRPWSKQVKIMLAFLIFESIRGVLGFRIFEEMVRNDAWQFNMLITLALYIFTIVIPVGYCFSNGFQLRRMLRFLLFMGLVLGVWSVTHSGFGPGGYLGDENDNCFALVSLLPFPFAYYSITKNGLSKLFCLFVGIVIFLGIAATNSRGGFIGLSLVVMFQFLLSRSKVKWVLGATFLAIISLPLVPQKYWDEIYSIKTEGNSEDGTIHERLETWKYISRMWMSPSNVLFGVGLENTAWNLGDYEDSGAGTSKKSLAGRAAHSMYFQILGDLGLWGIFVMGGYIVISIKQLRQIRFQIKRISKMFYIGNVKQSHESLGPLVSGIESELQFFDLLASAILCSWLGALGAGVGVSVAYYPIFWFLAGLSIAVYLYWTRIRDTVLTPIIESEI